MFLFSRKFKEAFEIAYALKKTKAKKTRQEYEVYSKRLMPFFEEISIKKFEENYLKIWSEYVRFRQERDFPPTSLEHDRKIFGYVLNVAYKKGWCRKFSIKELDIPFHEHNPKVVLDRVTIQQMIEFTKEKMPYKFHVMVCLGLMVGMRKSEVLGLRVDEINFAQREIRLQAKRVKTRKARPIPLNDYLIECLAELCDRTTTEYVFPSKKVTLNGVKQTHVKCIKRHMKRLREWFLLDFTFKDFRTTCATHMLKSGLSSELVSKILGNSTRVLSEYYHQFDDEQLETIREFGSFAS